ncbi:Uu.00g019580.m01.CDS01 [Anthostomella pinea]|uniref:Uu.00g019580.m01.CDS01 n=1 Tax=Anthostomella pinea TaxID=933095 RepID=A0AAI8VZA8_9PEZI|nr:Uu.00g019580.m01.CDS01 [Anthostomella pinea]
MLMPSALSCDSSRRPTTRYQSALFASPPSSPPSSPQNTFGNIVNSCRSLQSMLQAPALIYPSDNGAARQDQLPTPPLSHAPLPPLKLRLRSRKQQDANGDAIPRKKVVKRAAAPPRGANKRRRAADDDMGRDDDIDSDLEIESLDQDNEQEPEEDDIRPSTPKRARIAPEIIPLGLDRTDFHDLNAGNEEDNKEGTEIETEADGENWSKEDDRILVELVLEKLKLTKSDWQECARNLGKDRASIGRRWKSLMVNGDVGLKTRSRRSKIHSTWR